MAEQPVKELAKPTGRGAYWQALIEEWTGSGLSQQAFCNGRGINHQTFSWWKRRLRQQAAGPPPARRCRRTLRPSRFVELPGPAGRIGLAYEIQLTNGRILRLGPLVDPAALAQVLSVLERPC